MGGNAKILVKSIFILRPHLTHYFERYGASHKERFDSSGKGRGKVGGDFPAKNCFSKISFFQEGRVDKKPDGYVQGYKGKKEADAKMKR